ncbi:hypothetical protein [Spiroplasma endosymbiont of Acasis viretata]|uniref:hypothetical protein n=1 Tax=Spiroplasma endosymbiont of Acasis viretata TaxID=3066306 RepID=UPI00313D258E
MNKEYLKLIKVEFMHGVEEPWCNNQGVAILPYVLKDNEFHYLLTKNITHYLKIRKLVNIVLSQVD